LDAFASIEHIENIKNYLLPKIQKFSDKIDEYFQDNHLVREVVRGLDESISMKANKSEFIIIRGHLEKMFIPIEELERIEENYETLKKNIYYEN
jgi:hypothetical protein